MDLPGRAQYEQRAAREIARLFEGHAQRIRRAIGTDPRRDAINDALLIPLKDDLIEMLVPLLTEVYLAQARAVSGDTGIKALLPIKQDGVGIAWDVINERARAWAQQYAVDLATGVVDTTRRGIGDVLAQFFAGNATMADLEAKVAQLFGPVRAQMIAITEVTRAASEGEQEFSRELEAMGLQVTHIWETNDDPAVCTICEPRDGKQRGDGWEDFPPAHVGCRCWINTVVMHG